MSPRRCWVVRVALTPDEVDDHAVILECLFRAGNVHVNNERIFDLRAPRFIIRAVDTMTWAQRTAEHMQSFGYNAVAAPEWRYGDAEKPT